MIKKINRIRFLKVLNENLIFAFHSFEVKDQIQTCQNHVGYNISKTTLEIPYNEKLEHRRPLCIERERDPLHILLVAMRYYAHYLMRAVSQ